MVLVIDIGNSNITLGGYDGERLAFSARLSTETHKTADTHALELKSLFELNGISPSQIEGAGISSVVPAVSKAMCTALEKYFGITPVVVGPGVKTGLNIKIDNPAQLGADLAVGAVGALNKYKPPLVVFDLGTAITASVIGEKGDFLGGTISAGMRMSLDVLASGTAALPQISLEKTGSVIGKNTVDSMRAGIMYGTASMLDGLADRIEEELEKPITVVATGGNAKSVVSLCKRQINLEENLLLEGLLTIYNKNKK